MALKGNVGGNQGGFTEAGQRAKGKKLFADGALHLVGRLIDLDTAKAMVADRDLDIVAGETEVTTVEGVTLPLAPGFTISLSNLKTWACPFCDSAHGTGVGSSNNGDGTPKATALTSNVFYYVTKTQTVRVISKSCYSNWVVGEGYRSEVVGG